MTDKELNSKTKSFFLTNKDIIQIAFMTKEVIESCVKRGTRLNMSRANCYVACYQTAAALLEAAQEELFGDVATVPDELKVFYHPHYRLRIGKRNQLSRWKACPHCDEVLEGSMYSEAELVEQIEAKVKALRQERSAEKCQES